MRRPLPLRLVLAAFLLAGCAQTRPPEPERPPDYGRPLPPGAPALVRITDPSQIPDCRAAFGRDSELLAAIDRSLEYLTKPSSRGRFPMAGIEHDRCERSIRSLRDLLTTSPDGETFQAALVRDFDFYRAYGFDGRGAVYVTAYCTPIYEASLEPTERFRFPLYRPPAELAKAADGTPLGWRLPSGEVAPSPTRAEIEDGGLLEGRGLELCWLESPVDAYVIHVQGSAKLQLPDGRMLHVGYAGKTEHAYESVGLALVAAGRIPRGELSLASLRAHFRSHPDEVRTWLQRNPCYVFFQEYPPGMPYGSLGFPVTPYRTIATDKTIFPRAAPVFLDVDVPAATEAGVGTTRFRTFVLDQDTGGAIRAAGRADLYFGVGPEAERLAGRQASVGRMIYLFVKE